MYPLFTLTNLMKYLNWDVSPIELTKVINKCSMNNLKNYEDTTLNKDGKFLFYNSKEQKVNNLRFYNKGKIFSFKDSLSQKEIDSIYRQYKNYIHLYWPELEKILNV